MEISGAVPGTLGEVVSFSFRAPTTPRDNAGLLFYMIDTREGNRVYRINMNGVEQSQIALPPGDYFATLHTHVGNVEGGDNVVQFESPGQAVPTLDILNVVLFYED